VKLYFIQVVKADDVGGVLGPAPDLQEMLDYTPDESDHSIGFQILETEKSEVLYNWSWDEERWIAPSKQKISLSFGATAPPLSEQLNNFGFGEKKLERWQKDADAITRLSVRELITETEAKKARKRLLGYISESE